MKTPEDVGRDRQWWSLTFDVVERVLRLQLSFLQVTRLVRTRAGEGAAAAGAFALGSEGGTNGPRATYLNRAGGGGRGCLCGMQECTQPVARVTGSGGGYAVIPGGARSGAALSLALRWRCRPRR